MPSYDGSISPRYNHVFALHEFEGVRNDQMFAITNCCAISAISGHFFESRVAINIILLIYIIISYFFAASPIKAAGVQVESSSLSQGKSLGMVETLQTIARDEGPRGLYRGLLPNFLKVIPAVSIGYVVYEQLKHLLQVETVR